MRFAIVVVLLYGCSGSTTPQRESAPSAPTNEPLDVRIGDRDGDGAKDDVDRCPDDPEDYDAFEDQDGCPEPDNDRDGTRDLDDKCPNVPEDRDGFEDNNGCPE